MLERLRAQVALNEAATMVYPRIYLQPTCLSETQCSQGTEAGFWHHKPGAGLCHLVYCKLTNILGTVTHCLSGH